MRSSYLSLLLSSVALATAGSAWAQTTPAGQPPSSALSNPIASTDLAGPVGRQTSDATPATSAAEIVVTAEKRQERVQDIPIPVTVVSGAQLQAQHITTLSDLAQSAPALEFQAPGSGATGGGGTMRGIGTNSFSESSEPAVGVVVDGVVQGNANINNLFDIARVEVLRGPQGMLFGQSVSAGVLNITTNAPSPTKASGALLTELSGDGFLGSDYGRQILQGVYNQPLSDNSAVRIAAHINHLNNIQGNTYLHQGDDDVDAGARLRYLFDGGSGLRINLIADANDQRTTNGDFLSYRYVPPGSTLANLLTQCGVTPGDDNVDTCGQQPTHNSQVTYGFSGQIDYKLGGQNLTSITAYRKNDIKSLTDIDTLPYPSVATPIDIINGESDRSQELFTQEVRIASPGSARLEYTAGVYFSTYHQGYPNPTRTVLAFPFLPAPINVNYVEMTNTNITSIAGFGQATFHVTPQWRLIAGGRVTHELVKDKHLNPADTSDFAGASFQTTNFSWRLGTQYDFTRNYVGYFTATRGFKGAQINDTNTAVPAQIVQPEIPMDYELGLKTTQLNGQLAANINLFYISDKNYQGQTCVDDAAAGAVVCTPSNIPRILSRGVELELFGRPIHDLMLNAGFIFNPVKYPAGFAGSDGTDVGGQQLQNASRLKFTLTAEYSHSIREGIEGFVSSDLVARSAETLYPSALKAFTFDSSAILGAQIGVRTNSGWRVSLFGRNLTDTVLPAIIFPSVLAGAVNSSPSIQQYIIATSRRVVGLGISKSF